MVVVLEGVLAIHNIQKVEEEPPLATVCEEKFNNLRTVWRWNPEVNDGCCCLLRLFWVAVVATVQTTAGVVGTD